ncbi:MAG: hypothetical protein L3K23_06695 [Thermoplasmata archaeon]|nr:hypothetical protein [Thermoplasmata archaeon]
MRSSWFRTSLVTFATLVVVLSSLLALPASALGGGATHSAAGHSTSAAASAKSAAPAPIAPRPFVNSSVNVSGNFFQNTSGFTTPPFSQTYCTSTSYGYCYPQSQDPSIVRMTNGQIGVGFSQVTTRTTDTCSGAGANTGIRLGWVISKNNGTSFGSTTQLGNTTCSYEQALEPSFAAGPSGHVYGAFVESNATQYGVLGYYGSPTTTYTTRYDDALGFISISSNGTKFAKPLTVLAGGNISRPQIATFGETVYIVFENISNGTGPLPGNFYPAAAPIAVQLVYSADNGSTWHGPYTLPGLNPTELNTTMSPSVAVSSNGTVAVAYATNRSCLAFCGVYYGAAYGEEIVVATSLTNGTTWKGPFQVQSNVGEYYYFQGVYFNALFQEAPETAIAWDDAATAWEVAWAGALNLSLPNGYYYSDYSNFQVGVGSSLNDGVTWNTSLASPPVPETTYSGGSIEYYNPALGANNGEVTLTFTEYNQTYTGGNCGPVASGTYLSPSITLWTANSTNGLTWSPPLIAAVVKPPSSGYYTYLDIYYDYQGFLGSVGYTAAGTVLLGYAVALSFQQETIGANTEYVNQVKLMVAQPYQGTNSTLTVEQHGLAAGSRWGFAVDGNVFESTNPNITVVDVPTTQVVVVVPVTAATPSAGYWREYQPILSSSGAQVVKTPTILYLNYTLWDGIAFNPQPLGLLSGYSELYVYNQSQYTYYEYYEQEVYCYSPTTCYTYNSVSGCPFPWYVPDGTTLQIRPSSSGGPQYAYYNFELPVSYWNGTGPGSYTGTGSSANLTVHGAINQTMWLLPYGTYSEYFGAPTLPVSSTFNLTFDGQNVSAPGGGALGHAVNVTTGAYWVTHAQATSSESGWAYFGGPASGNPVLVPLQSVVNMSFAAVNLSSSLGTISFHAQGLTPGTVWQFEFNGSTLSSNTPWINVTAHSGIYPTSAYVVTSYNGSAGYTPNAVPSTWTLDAGQTYQVNYTPAYRIDVVAGAGGAVSPTTSSYWVAPGTIKSFTATPAIGYAFQGWSGEGAGSFSGNGFMATVTANGPIVEVAAFYPLVADRFNLSFSENGIPNGTSWTVNLNGVGYSSTNNTLTVPNVYSCQFSGGRGRYTVTVPYAYDNGTSSLTRYVAKPYPATLCGGGAPESLNFSAQYFLTLEWTSGGNASVAFGATVSSNSTWVPGLTAVTLQATPNPGFIFLGWNGSGAPGNFTGVQPIGSAAMEGPITEIAAFGIVYVPPPPRYWVSFHLGSTLPAGQTWLVTFNGANYSSSTAYLNISNLLAGSYSVAVPTIVTPDGLTQYAAVGVNPRIGITANSSYAISYATSYWVSISEVGGGSVSPASGWFPANAAVPLVATPDGTNLFSGWVGTGPGAYSGTNATPPSVRVGGPMTEVATFVPPVPPAVQVASAFNTVPVWAGLALVGLVVGLVIGLIAVRARGRRAPPAPYAPEPVEGSSPEAPPPGNPPPEGGEP